MLQLQVIHGKNAGKCLCFQQSVVHIGTEIGNDFRIEDAQGSAYHGKFVCSQGHYAYCDLQSEHGTRVRASGVDVMLYSRQMPQSVALMGEAHLSIGESEILCRYFEAESAQRYEFERLDECSLLTLSPTENVSMMQFLLETSMALTAKTTHLSVMSYLSKVILQRLSTAMHVAIWRYEECRESFSCVYERSRGDTISPRLLDQREFSLSLSRRAVVSYRMVADRRVGVVVAPLVTAMRKIGVMVVDLRLDEDTSAHETIARLSEVAAYAIERTLYNADISALFDGFVRAIIAVMDARDPASAGHSRRVSKYALMTAQAIHADQRPVFAPIQFSSNHLDEIRIAGLLHDIGKVVLRREILLKSSKLTPGDLKHLLDRISLFSAWFSTQSAEKLGPRYRSRQRFELYRELVTRLQQIQSVANEKDRQLIEEMARTYIDPCPTLMLLSPQEKASLLIAHGTLTQEERREIERHALISYQYLSQIAWPQRWANVPIFVLQHHEKLNGTGYPYGLKGDRILLQSRILTVCDIFDALTGGDRPYKTRCSFGDAADLLLKEVRAGALDAAVVDLFIDIVIPQLSTPDISSSGLSPVVEG